MIRKISILYIVMLLLVVSFVSAFELLGSTGYQADLEYPYNQPRVIGDIAYMGSYDGYYLTTWNISNLSNIVELDASDSYGTLIIDLDVKQYPNGQIWVYMIGDDYIWSQNVTDPSNIGEWYRDWDSYSEIIQIHGDLAYSGYMELYIHNISEIGSKSVPLIEVYSTNPVPQIWDMQVRDIDGGTYLFTSGTGFVIYNVTDPYNTYKLSNLSGSAMVGSQGMDVVGDIVYYGLENPSDRILTINISDLSNPFEMTYILTPDVDTAYHLRVYDNILYSTSYNGDAIVSYNVSDPYDMKYIDSISGIGSPNYLDGAWKITIQDHSRIYVNAYDDSALTILSNCGTYTCINYDTCQPDIAGGYIPCIEVESTYCNDEQYQNNDGDYSEFLTSCNYCTAEESESVGECEINPETEYQSYRKLHSYILTNNATCCQVTGNSTDCEVTEGYWESCGISGITGDVVANDPVYIATSSIIYAVLVIAVIIFILIGAVENMKGKGKGELIK